MSFSKFTHMTLEDARTLIEGIDIGPNAPQHWADLGCGTGLFSHALASMLPEGSRILCLDQNDQNISAKVPEKVELDFRKADFTTYEFEHTFDGFMLANSLHYVSDKALLLTRLARSLSKHGSLVIIEYDRDVANQWVPFPVTFPGLKQLLRDNGLADVRKLSERRSAFGPMMYACQAKMNTFPK